MFKKMGLSAFLFSVTISQAFAEGHVTGGHGAPAEQEHMADAEGLAHAAGHAAEHASGGLPQLDPSSFLGQVFWLTIVFVFMYIFFAKKTVPQIGRTIENRTERINSDLDSAERLKNEVAELQKSYEEKLTQAREESFAVFVNTEKEIKQEAEQHAAEFQENSRKKIEKLEKSIEDARDTAMKEMGDIAADIAIQASEKIIGIKPDEKTAKAIVKSLSKSKAA